MNPGQMGVFMPFPPPVGAYFPNSGINGGYIGGGYAMAGNLANFPPPPPLMAQGKWLHGGQQMHPFIPNGVVPLMTGNVPVTFLAPNPSGPGQIVCMMYVQPTGFAATQQQAQAQCPQPPPAEDGNLDGQMGHQVQYFASSYAESGKEEEREEQDGGEEERQAVQDANQTPPSVVSSESNFQNFTEGPIETRRKFNLSRQ
jgi:hypothetical protein